MAQGWVRKLKLMQDIRKFTGINAFVNTETDKNILAWNEGKCDWDLKQMKYKNQQLISFKPEQF